MSNFTADYSEKMTSEAAITHSQPPVKRKPKGGKSRFRKVVDWLHRWLGLVSGIVVLILGLTGCLFVFQEEISNVTDRQLRFVAVPAQAHTLPISTLLPAAQAALGKDQPINYITTYARAGHTWEFMAYAENDRAITYGGSIRYYRTAYVNPYTGALTGVANNKWNFFIVVKAIHWSLLLSTPYGQPITGWCTVVFVLLLITGLIMWWPKKWNRKTRNDSFSVRWKARFKRVNYDLHNVLGFYSLLVALVLALTGMVFAFTWFQAFAYVAASGTTTPPAQAPVLKSQVMAVAPAKQGIDIAFENAHQLMPNADRFGLSPAVGKEGLVYVNGYRGRETYYNYDSFSFDQYSGKLLHRNDYKQRNAGEKLVAMNYDIHVGAIAGLPGKILAFLASLVSTSLPVTGFIIWWGKRRKKR